MTSTADLLDNALGRILDVAAAAIADADEQALTYRVDPQANTIAWLVWHLTRVQDDHVSGVAGREQLWTAAGWAERFGLRFDVDATGYGQTPDEVAAVRAPAQLLAGYLEAVTAASREFVRGLTDGDLDRVVDERWDPPVTLGVRLVSVISDDLQHAGQAALIRGIFDRS